MIFLAFLWILFVPSRNFSVSASSDYSPIEESIISSLTKSFVQYFKISHLNVYYEGKSLDEFSKNMMKNTSNLFFQSVNTRSTKAAFAVGKNSITLHLYLDQNFDRLNEIVDEHERLRSKHMKIETVGFPQKDYFLIRIPDQAKIKEIKELFTSTLFKYDSLAFCLQLSQINNSAKIYDAYKIGPNTLIKSFGEFIDGNLIVPTPEMWERRADMEGHHLRAAAALNPPYIYYLEDNCTSTKCFKGSYSRIWSNLQTKMNFTYTIRKESVWGVKINGTWHGLIGMCERKEIDIAPADLGVTKDRSSVADFLPGITPTYQQLYIRNPAASNNWQAYLEPFQPSCWIVIIGFLTFIPFLVAAILSYGNERCAEEYGLIGSFIFVSKAMIMRTTSTMPFSYSSRITFFTIMLAGSFLYWHWEASVISFLSVRKTDLPIRTLKDVLEKTNLKLLLHRGTLYVDEFRHAKEPYKVKLYKERIEPYLSDYPLVKEDVSKMLAADSSYALYDSIVTKQYDPYLSCKIIDTGVIYNRITFNFAMPKNSQYYAAFYYHISKLKEGGVIKRYQNEEEPTAQNCPDFSGKAITGGQCFTAFLTLMIGAGVSSVWFIFEWLIPKTTFSSLLDTGNRNSEKITNSGVNIDEEIQSNDLKFNGKKTIQRAYNEIRKGVLDNVSYSSILDKLKNCEDKTLQMYELIELYHSKTVSDCKIDLNENTELNKAPKNEANSKPLVESEDIESMSID